MRLRLLIGLIVTSWLFVVAVSNALETIELEIEQTEYSGWKLDNLNVNLSTEHPPKLFITAQQISSPTGGPFRDLQIHCEFSKGESPVQSLSVIECPSGYFSFHHKKFGHIKGELGFSYQANTGEVNFDVSELHFVGGKIKISGNLANEKWFLDLKARSIDIARLKKLVTLFAPWPKGISDESGRLHIDLAVHGHDTEWDSAKLRLRTLKLNFDGSSVAENLNADLDLSIQRKNSRWHVSEALNLKSGAIYIEPGIKLGNNTPGLLLEPGKKGIKQKLQGVWQKDRLLVDSFSFSQPDVIDINVSADLGLNVGLQKELLIEKLKLSFKTDSLKKVFPIYLQPLLYGSGLDDMELVGQAELTVKFAQNSITDFHLILGDVYLDDQDDRFHVAGLDGDIRLNSDPEPALSNMNWRAGSIYQILIGSGQMKLASEGRSMYLRDKLVIPVFDGELQIEDLKMDNLGLENYSVHIDSKLTPIALSEFTEAMGWPIMAGNVSGEIPGVSYYKGDLAVDGELNVKVFDGDIAIRQLKIEDLFNTVPHMFADIKVTDLDLGLLTQTFEFGDISGKLSGYMRNMQLEDWQPVRFDASFFTPEDDKSRHRISQRAIDNLTSIGGGGASNAISKGILGMFEEFPYSKIGISCRLEKDTCNMRGVEKTGDGYYIVKRGFLPPWLEIKGYNRKVNWHDLLERLQNISKTEGPVVE